SIMNECLEKMIQLSQTFLNQAQKNNFKGVDQFDESREVNFKFLVQCNQSLDALTQALIPVQLPQETQNRLRDLALDYHSLARTLSLIDEKIEIHIESHQSLIRKELTVLEKQSLHVKKFKSTWLPESGERLDDQI
ncbi:hypothetical protein EBS43_00460, partial [bacterium]|nr:hypothetical protein [bacterium]